MAAVYWSGTGLVDVNQLLAIVVDDALTADLVEWIDHVKDLLAAFWPPMDRHLKLCFSPLPLLPHLLVSSRHEVYPIFWLSV